jgi:Ni/Fe-hydrogenase subunit HybB-like protein
MVVFSFIANRLNVGITGLEAGSGTHYMPKWSEVAVTLSLVAVGFAIFRVIGQHFPVFEAHSPQPASEQSPEETEVDPLAVG